jgi:hypothetical protein
MRGVTTVLSLSLGSEQTVETKGFSSSKMITSSTRMKELPLHGTEKVLMDKFIAHDT